VVRLLITVSISILMLSYLYIIISYSTTVRFAGSLAFQSLSQKISISTIPRHKSSTSILRLENSPFMSKRLPSQGSLKSISKDEGGRRRERASLAALPTDDLEEEGEEGVTTNQARNNFFKIIGTPSPLVMAPMVNPICVGIPQFWPARPAWRQIVLDPIGGETTFGTAYASDGLTNPWEDEEIRKASDKPELGLGFEVIMGSFDLPSGTVLSAVMQVSNILTRHPLESLPFFMSLRDDEKLLLQLYPELRKGEEALNNDNDGIILLGTMSLEIEGDEFPEELRHPDTGRVGILINGGITTGLPLTFALPRGQEAHVLELVVLHPQELEHIITCHLPARMEISRRLRALESKWCSSSSRQSVVPVPPPNQPSNSDKEAIEIVKGWPSK